MSPIFLHSLAFSRWIYLNFSVRKPLSSIICLGRHNILPSEANRTAVDWIDWKRNVDGGVEAGAWSTGIFIACTRPTTRGRHILDEATFLLRQLSLDTARRGTEAFPFNKWVMRLYPRWLLALYHWGVKNVTMAASFLTYTLALFNKNIVITILLGYRLLRFSPRPTVPPNELHSFSFS